MAEKEPTWKGLLKTYHSKLRTGLLLDNVLPALRPLLTDAEYLNIEGKEGDLARVDELVKILLTKDSTIFEDFCCALETNGYPRWANKLRGNETSEPLIGDGLLVGSPTLSGDVPIPTDGPVIHSVHQSKATVGTEWTLDAILSYFRELIQKMKRDCRQFGILVVGETGTGKSTLINNLVGQEIVIQGDSFVSETSTISKHEMDVEGVPIAVYDTPGLDDSRGGRDDEYLQKMKSILNEGKIHLVIYCLKLSETRMRGSLLRTFQEYHRIGVKWERSVIAFTFADVVPVPSRERKKPGFDIGCFFNNRVAELRAHITRKLVENVGVSAEIASEILCNPSTSDPEELLPNGDRWFVPFWLHILYLLSPSAMIQFLQVHVNSITYSNPEVTKSHAGSPVAPPPPDYNTVIGHSYNEERSKTVAHDIAASDPPHSMSASERSALGHTDCSARPLVLEREDEVMLGSIIAKKIKTYASKGAFIGAFTGGVVGASGGPLGIVLGGAVGAVIGGQIGGFVGFIKSLFTKQKKQ